jgi:type IV pilus assembly protein PilO
MNLKDPNVQRILLIVVIVVVASYLYFGTELLPFFYQVRKAKIEAMEQEYGKLSADLEKARQMVGKLAELEAEYDRLHEQWLSAQELLPVEQEMPDLLRQVTTAGVRAGVEFMLFQPTAAEIREDYKAYPVKIRVRGGYHQLGIFLSRLANLERMVNVSHLDVKSEKSGGDKNAKENDRNTVIADFTLTAHTLLPSSIEGETTVKTGGNATAGEDENDMAGGAENETVQEQQ